MNECQSGFSAEICDVRWKIWASNYGFISAVERRTNFIFRWRVSISTLVIRQTFSLSHPPRSHCKPVPSIFVVIELRKSNYSDPIQTNETCVLILCWPHFHSVIETLSDVKLIGKTIFIEWNKKNNENSVLFIIVWYWCSSCTCKRESVCVL